MTRREWLAMSALVLSSACGRPKGTGYAGYALVATSGDNSLAVVDLTAFRLLKPIPLGAPPTAVVPDGPGNCSYVLTPSTGTVHVVDTNLQRVLSRRLADELSEIRITPDAKRLVAIAAKTHELIEADAISLKVLSRHKLDAAPLALDLVQPEGNGASHAAVSTGEHGTVELFNLTTGQYARAQLSGQIGAVRFRADGQLLLVANLRDRSLTALEVPTLQVMVDLPLAMQPDNLCFNFDQGQLFVTGEGMDGVAIVFPYDTVEVEQTVLAGRDPGVMACSGGNPSYLFVGSGSGSDVCVMDVDRRKVIGLVDVGQQPAYITITPDDQYALVLDEASGDMAVIHIRAMELSQDAGFGYRQKSGAALFAVIPVGNKPVHAAVMPRLG